MPLYPGKPVLYRFRPGQVRMGQTEAAAMITRIYPDGACDLTVYPPSNPEPLFQSRVPQKAREEDFHCWRLNEDDGRIEELERRISELEAKQAGPASLQDFAMGQASALGGNLSALAGCTMSGMGNMPLQQDPPRRGRPRKVIETT